ncbi:MAG: serine acetyltransferase, partial [Ginsengibacter sp.]
MDKAFFEELFSRQQKKEIVPSNSVIASWALNLINLLFPEHSICAYSSLAEIQSEYKKLERDLVNILNAT